MFVMVTSAYVKFDFRHIIPTSRIGKTDIILLSAISTNGAPAKSFESCLELSETQSKLKK